MSVAKSNVYADERIIWRHIYSSRKARIRFFECVVADIFMYNSNCVYACSTFEQRYEWLKDLMKTFMYHVPGTVRLIHKSDLSPKQKLKGYGSSSG